MAQKRAQQQLQQQPPAQEVVEQQVAPPQVPDQAQEPEQQQPVLTPRANERIAELAREKNEANRMVAEAMAERQRMTAELEQLRQERQQLQAERDQYLQQNLANLDPDQRIQVLAQMEAKKGVQQAKQEMLAALAPTMEALQAQTFRGELRAIADKYPYFDAEKHPDEILKALRKNPGLTTEQAFRAVAEDHELATASPQDTRIPQVLPPRGTQQHRINFNPQPAPVTTQSDDGQIFQEWSKLNQSNDPADRVIADRLSIELMKRARRAK